METVILLDVDGVLVPFGPYSQHKMIAVGPVFVRKKLRKWLQDLSEKSEIYWATSWQANAKIFEHELEFHCQGFLDFSKYHTKNYLWGKLETIEIFCQQNIGKKFVLIDDNANDWLLTASSVLTELMKEGKLLVIKPDAYVGISDKEMKKVSEYVKNK
ncbi:HAD domain-containing protein [Lactococcus protaetiae]|uniref:FCP1 homology domain-containing protein n=1 Tax=Lactococcus protaetiae TaxID=2592653 RepID=A0A514Z972_9LACT|nr:HAD domain-containing protein [Lactococcus protaetiae]QDK71087.1 hypothetical protein FLP15_07895 [Lactococcus protaetiae]